MKYSHKSFSDAIKCDVAGLTFRFFVALILASFFHSCTKDDPSTQKQQIPTITSFSPTEASTGATVIITGTNFTGTTAVSFGGTAATSFTVTNATTITAVVGSGATGDVKVTTAAGSGTFGGFTFLGPPTVTSFSPTQANAGATVTITGTNFTGATAVSFGGTAATSFTVTNATTITAVVGNGATGAVKVTTATGSGTFGGFTFLSPPTVTSFSPTEASTGATVIITGTNFTGTTAVSFGGTAATSFTVSNATTITAVVGNGATGDVEVTTAAGSATFGGFTFLNPPTITSFSPTQANAGSTVTITGTDLSGTTAVSFGGAAATSFAVTNATTIAAVVGNGATGEVKVSKGTVTAVMAGFVYLGGSVACKLPEQSGRGDIGIGFPRIGLRTPSTGTVKVSVIFVDFSDAVATSTPQTVFGSHISPSSENFMTAVSYGKLSLQFEPTYQWFRMSQPSTGYGWTNLTFNTHKAYIQEAIALADPTVDFSRSEAFLIVAPPSASAISYGPAFTALAGNGITADGKTFYNGVTSGADLTAWNGLWFAHEFGHTMALVDLYGYSGSIHRFVGEFSIMGLISGKGHEMLGWERWLLGWLDDSEVNCQSNAGTGTVTLAPIEQIGTATKLLVIPTGATTAVVVESRRALAFDSQLPKAGPLVYFVDTSIASGNGAIKVLPVNDSDESKLQNTLTLNQTLTYGNVSIKYVSTDSAGDEVQFTKN